MKSAVEYLFKKLWETPKDKLEWYAILSKAKQMEKEQSIDLIKQTAMFMGASNFDKEISSMTFEDVYNSYHNK